MRQFISIVEGETIASATSPKGIDRKKAERIEDPRGFFKDAKAPFGEMRDLIGIVESARMVTLYHGTCAGSAEALCRNGWQPGSGQLGANMGQTRYLYLTSGIEDAEWFAEQKGCTTVVAVTVPLDHLIVDPEDGVGDTVEDELNSPHGLPGKVALTKAAGPDAFEVVRA